MCRSGSGLDSTCLPTLCHKQEKGCTAAGSDREQAAAVRVAVVHGATHDTGRREGPENGGLRGPMRLWSNKKRRLTALPTRSC